MKQNYIFSKVFLFLALFCILGMGSTVAQSVRLNFIRYKMTEFHHGSWDEWPTKWNNSGAYAIVSNVYNETYKVSVYSYDDEHLVTSVCTFDSKTTREKRSSQDLPYLNCYTDPDGDQIWTNIVSLESLLKNVKNWEQDDAALYLWIFSSDPPIGIVCE